MMKAIVLVLFAAASAAHAFEFLPTEKKEKGEAGEYVYLQFRNGPGHATYLPPRNWEYKGDPNRLVLTPKGILGSDVDMTVVALKEPLACTEANLKAFESIALQMLPKGASSVETQSLTFTPFEIDGRTTVEVILSYAFYGQKLKACFTYVSTDKKVLQFRVAGRLADFEGLRKAFQASLHTLAGVKEPEPTSRVQVNRAPTALSFR